MPATVQQILIREIRIIRDRLEALEERAKDDEETHRFVGGMTFLRLGADRLLLEMEEEC
jgi:hypothetical protein